MRNPAPMPRNTADGWEQTSKSFGARNLEMWVFWDWGLPGIRSASMAGGTPWRGRVRDVLSCSEQPSFCIGRPFWDLGSRFRVAVKRYQKMGALHGMQIVSQ